jgi:Zn-dependent protease/GNAT superfamily N-acetyltransferase
VTGLVVRQARPGDDRAIWEVAKTLSIIERYYFYYLTYRRQAASAWVAEEAGRIAGCVIPIVTTIAGEKAGLVGGIFVDRRAQGKGVGKALAGAALQRFREEGCQTYYVLVDRYNSSSWNMFLHQGFEPFPFDQQLRTLGWGMVSLWRASGYLFEPGTFILRKGGRKREHASELGDRWHLLLAWLGSSVILWLGLGRTGPLAAPLSAAVVAGVTGLSIWAHELSHRLVAGWFGLKTVFRVWESGLLFSALLALLGVTPFYPSYGSTFIAQEDWPYPRHPRKLGPVHAAGPLVSLLLALAFLGLFRRGEQLGVAWFQAAGGAGALLNYLLVLFNLIPVFPFGSFDGQKILRWSRPVWALLVAGFLLLHRAGGFRW